MAALLKGKPRHYRTLKKKRRLQGKVLEMRKATSSSSETGTLIFTLFILGVIFAILLFFKPS